MSFELYLLQGEQKILATPEVIITNWQKPAVVMTANNSNEGCRFELYLDGILRSNHQLAKKSEGLVFLNSERADRLSTLILTRNPWSQDLEDLPQVVFFAHPRKPKTLRAVFYQLGKDKIVIESRVRFNVPEKFLMGSK